MGQKDISEKILEAYNDVFADIVNVLLFDGEMVIHPADLEEQAPRYAYKADGKIREIERDVAKRWKKDNIRIACVGLENQTDIDADMPLRIIGYDGAEYRAQLNSNQVERYPVITMVLYYNHENKWNKPTNLLERLNINERMKPFVNDYKVNLFEIAFLDDEKVKLFKSDFGIVADYFAQMRKTGDYIPSAKQLDHVQETLGLLSVMTDDKRFEETLNDVDDSEDEKEVKTMCEFLDRVEAKGMSKGEEKKAIQVSIALYKDGMGIEKIAEIVDASVEKVTQWLGLVMV